MGIDVDGGMIVGLPASEVTIPEEHLLAVSCGGEAMEECDYFDLVMDNMSPYFDSDSEDWVVGFKIRSGVECWDRYSMEFGAWLDELDELSDRFYEITGKKPKLIGMQDVT